MRKPLTLERALAYLAAIHSERTVPEIAAR